jgi:RsiW-degrading membrane proteinase PrsW (M82 family)
MILYIKSKPITFLLVGFVLLTLLVQWSIVAPEFESNQERFNHVLAHESTERASKSLARLIQSDSVNYEYHFWFGFYWSQRRSRDRVFLRNELNENGDYPLHFYDDPRADIQGQDGDIAKYGRACLAYFNHQPKAAGKYLAQLTVKDKPGVNHLLGLVAISEYDKERAIDHFVFELKNEAFRDEALHELGKFYSSSDIKTLCANEIPKLEIEVPLKIKIRDAYHNNEFLSFIGLRLEQYVQRFSALGMTAAMLIMFVWLYYLHHLGAPAGISVQNNVISLLGGGVSAFLGIVLYNTEYWLFRGVATADSLSTALDTFFRIGLIEESVKLLPLIIMGVAFRKKNWKPADYIIAASLSGLGFSILEDFAYFTDKKLDIISSRFLISGGLHMAWTSLAAYGFVTWKFRKQGKVSWRGAIGHFLLAILIHGMYDFVLMQSVDPRIQLLAIPIAFVSLVVWVGILNNALNNSGIKRPLQPSGWLRTFLITSFASIVFFEYFLSSILFGAMEANEVLYSGVAYGALSVPVLAFILSRIDVTNGGWFPIHMTIHRPMLDMAKILNAKFEIKAYRDDSKLAKLVPLHGRVTERVTISNDTYWFIFKPELVDDKGSQYFIRAKDTEESSFLKQTIVDVRLKKPGKGAATLSSYGFLGWAIISPNK